MQKGDNRAQLFGLALQMGYLIVIPLVLLALGGRFIDRLFGSSPLFFLIGVLLAIVSSTVLVYRKTVLILQNAEDIQRMRLDAVQGVDEERSKVYSGVRWEADGVDNEEMRRPHTLP